MDNGRQEHRKNAFSKLQIAMSLLLMRLLMIDSVSDVILFLYSQCLNMKCS